jgi:hypothetical protein
MNLIIDSHIHIYPCYSLNRAFSTLVDRFNAVDAQAIKIACLTERYDCDYFKELSEGRNGDLESGFAVHHEPNGNFLRITRASDGTEFSLLPGRQVVAQERVEVIGLNHAQHIADGTPAKKIVDTILDNGGTPMLAWSPGKWFSTRGKVILMLLQDYSYSRNDLLIGDTSLRPLGWLKPFIMRDAEAMGYKVIAGSDPLPFAGEEDSFGTYISTTSGSFEQLTPPEILHRIVSDPAIKLSSRGNRSNPVAFARRLHKNAASK